MDNPVQRWLLTVLNRIMMVKDTTPSWCIMRECGLEPLQFNWLRAAVRLYTALIQSNSSTAIALFITLPTPTNDLFPRLMVEVCLVLAPDVNFFLNSRKQGLPRLRSLFFSFLHCWAFPDHHWQISSSFLTNHQAQASGWTVTRPHNKLVSYPGQPIKRPFI